MLKVEFKRIFKSLLIISLIVGLLLGGVTLLYPTIMGDAAKDIDKLLETMPQEFLAMFNMDVVSIEKASGWLLSEGYMMFTIIGAIYFAYLGSTILLKEENDKTIFFLATKPVSRTSILLSKLFAGLLALVIFNVIVGDLILIGLYINDDLIFKQWFYMILGPTIIDFVFYAIGFLLGVLGRKLSSTVGISVGMVLISYLLLIISKLSDKVDFIKFSSIFYYADSNTIIEKNMLETGNLLIILLVGLVCIGLSIFKYKDKELF